MPTQEPMLFLFFISSTVALLYRSLMEGWKPPEPGGTSMAYSLVAAPECRFTL